MVTILSISRMGLLGKRVGERAARFSDWCWFLATIAALIELGFERSVTKSRIKTGESFISINATNSTYL